MTEPQDQATYQEALPKYRSLYDLAIRVFDEEMARSNRIDAKASAYLAALTLLLGAATFFGNHAISQCLPPRGVLQTALLVLMALSFVALVAAWVAIFSVLKVHAYEKIPLKISLFDEQDELNVYYAYARSIEGAIAHNRQLGNKKSRRIYRGYVLITYLVVLLSAAAIAYTANEWSSRSATNIRGHEESVMNGSDEKPTDDRPAPRPIPDPNVQPPTPDVVTEGFDPSKVQHKKDQEQRD